MQKDNRVTDDDERSTRHNTPDPLMHRTTEADARIECDRHMVDCSTCPLSENCPLHGTPY